MLLNNTSWVFFANIYRVFLVFIRSIIIAKALSAATFGQYVTILALTASLQAFFNLNIGTMFTKFGAGYVTAKRNDKLFSLIKLSFLITAIALSASLAILSIFIHFSYDVFIDQPGLKYHILLLAVAQGMIFFDYTSLSLLRLFYKFKQNSLITVGIITLELAVILVSLVVYKVNLDTFLVIIILQKFTSSLIFNGFCFWEIRSHLRGFAYSKISLISNDFREIRHFIVVNYGSRLLKTLIDQGDVLLLSAFTSNYEVGIFGVGKRLGMAILSVTDPLMNAVFPQVSRMISGRQYQELIKMLKQITSSILIMVGLALIPMYFFRYDVVSLAYGAEFRDGGNVFFIIALSAVTGGVFFWYTSLLLNLELVVYRFKLFVVLLISGLTLGLLIIPAYGAIGAALVVLAIKVLEVGAGAFKSIHTLKSRIVQAMKEVNLKPYQGKCNMIYGLQRLVGLSFSSLFTAVIVHGSIANEDEIAYSDFDGLLILKGGATENPLFHEFIKVSQKIILKFDPLQHHGWFMIKESELNSYPEHYLPSLVLESSMLIWPKKPMRLTVQSSDESDFIKPFSHLSSHVLSKVERGWRPTNMYQLKSFLSEVMLLPCLFITAMDQKPVLKELSFEAAEKRFPNFNWSSVQAASLIRSSWDYHLNPIQKLVMRQPGRFWRKVTEKKVAPAIPQAMDQVLDEVFYIQLSELVHHMKNEVK